MIANKLISIWSNKTILYFRSNTIEFSIASLTLQISLWSLTSKVMQVDKTEKLNEQIFFEDVYCNN